MKITLEIEDKTLVQILSNFAPLLETYLNQLIQKAEMTQKQEKEAKELVEGLKKTGATLPYRLLKAIADAEPKTEDTEPAEEVLEEPEPVEAEAETITFEEEPTPEPEEVVMTASTEVLVEAEPAEAKPIEEPEEPTPEPEEVVMTASTEVLVEAEPAEAKPIEEPEEPTPEPVEEPKTEPKPKSPVAAKREASRIE